MVLCPVRRAFFIQTTMADLFRTILATADDVILDALGETVVITGKGNLVGVLEEESAYDLEMQGTTPVFHYQEADMTVAVGDALVYGGITYTVRKIETDGVGMGRLVLSRD